MDSIQTRVGEITQKIIQTCRMCDRDPRTVTIVAASKQRTIEEIQLAHQAGIHVFAENYVQAWRDKALAIKAPVKWHFIGKLQRNKAKYLVGQLDLIHSVDSLKLAEQIHKHAEHKGITQDILIQINLSEEPSKAGISIRQFEKFIHSIKDLESICVRGFMTFPPPVQEAEGNRPFFRQLYQLIQDYRGLQQKNLVLDQLSMGTSDDYLIAIQEGATLVRLGRSIFGPR